MPKAVRFDRYGGSDVLSVVEVERPKPRKTQLLVRVKAAGINPGEAVIRKGLMREQFPAKFPSGEGSDLAGVVEEVGEGVQAFAVGDEIIGYTDQRASHAELVLVEVEHAVRKPSKVPWEQAGSLFVAGTTAYAALQAVHPTKGECVVISGAAGGVGTIAVQLAARGGAKVIGLASPKNREWLEKHGATHVAYGDGVTERIRAASGGKIDAFIDTFGSPYVELALELGVKPDRINTIIDFAAVKKYQVKSEGNAAGATPDVLSKLAELIDKGELEIPIAKVFPLTSVREAFDELEQRHTHGKIVLQP
jgi:NADPH:quinone reductase-like Zn-dependent oxidoreductase